MICLYKIAAGFTFIITQDIFAFLQINPVPELMKPILCNDIHIRITVDHIKDNLDILDFRLADDEMAEIAKLDKGVRYYTRTDEMLASFAAWRP